MEINQVIRIVATILAVAAFAIHVATRLIFPDANSSSMPIAICIIIALWVVWRDADTVKNEQTNEQTNK